MAKKTTRKKRSKTGARRTPVTPSAGLAGIDTAELAAELRRREASLGKIERKREKLLAQLEEVEAELAEAGALLGAAGGVPSGRKRHRNDSSLEDALVDLLNNTVMSVTDATEAVQRAGYRTTSPNFRTIVNQTLIKSNKFKKVARGQYTAK
ncbi:MAG: hypothetical protein EA378_06315 [Phycisphaerales bacterium]|nr:MAG: hypothetical protein EA378_06315 [Phycisphaerales bacterium]